MSRHSFYRFFAATAAISLLLLGLQLYPHRSGTFIPDYGRVEIAGLLEKAALGGAEYEQIFLQTGLGRGAVDAYRAAGQENAILAAQDFFFSPPTSRCDPLAAVTWEDHLSGTAIPMAPVEDGDVLLSFSTHTLGWRHGHAGVVADGAEGLTLEAVVIGSDAALLDLGHWGRYTTLLHLRLTDVTPGQQRQIAATARGVLLGVPYRLTSGLAGDKFPPPEEEVPGAQCAYLVWYALMSAGYDTDGDGGRLVTVDDLAHSPLFEVVQVYGIDPRHFCG